MLFDCAEWWLAKRSDCQSVSYIPTEEKLRKDEIDNAETATSVHYFVGREVCTAIEKIVGIMPEDLPTPEKSIQQIEKGQMACLKAKAKKEKLMHDE